MTANEAFVRDAIAAFNARDLAAWLARFDPDARFYTLDISPDLDTVYAGHEGLAALWDSWLEPWDQLRLELVGIDDEGDVVALDLRWIGETAGAPVEMPLGLALTVRDGRWTQLVAALTGVEARDKLLAIARDSSGS